VQTDSDLLHVSDLFFPLVFFTNNNNNGSDGTDEKDDEDAEEERRACERARVRTPKDKKADKFITRNSQRSAMNVFKRRGRG
jgi:hypothetical protein